MGEGGAPFMVGLLGAFCLSAVSVAGMRRALTTAGAIDQPGERRSHSVPTPRGGGVGIVAGWTLVLVLLVADPSESGWVALLAAVLAIAALGFRDDLRDVPAVLRVALQAAVSLAFLLALWPVPITLGGWDFPVAWPWLGVFTLVFVAGINFYNFLDGINGIAALQAMFGGVLLGAVGLAGGDGALALACFGLAAAAAGFVPWNFPHARVFMGDVGSTAIGLGFCALGVIGAERGTWQLLTPALAMSLFVVDALLTVLGRMARGARWYTAHREHAYQKLTISGWSHTAVTLTYGALNVAVVAPVVWLTRDSGPIQLLAGIALWGFLAILWLAARRS
ncbi:MAG: glycosyl transferase family 4 [Pseudomonadota bacterium]